MGRTVVHNERAEDRDLPRLSVILARCRKSARYSREAKRRIVFHLKEAIALMVKSIPAEATKDDEPAKEAAPGIANANGKTTNGATNGVGKARGKRAAA